MTESSGRIDLSFACTKYDRTAAILDGTVKPDGINLISTSTTRPGEIFWRMLLHEEFDCSEMSLSSYSIVKTLGKKDWQGIPAFTARRFFNVDPIVTVDSGIKEPKDLEGKKVGVPEYQMSAAVWIRGILHDEYDVRPEKIQWYVGRRRDLTREKVTGIEAPPNVHLTFLENTSIGEALLSGKLDAALLHISIPSLVDSTSPDLSSNPRIRTLFPDPKSEAIRYFKKTGVIPINHTIVIKNSVHQKYPWAATNMFKALEESKLRAYEMWRDLEDWEKFSSAYFVSDLIKEQRKLFGDDPFPYGLSKNRRSLETLGRYLFEQGLVPVMPDYDKMFAAQIPF